jgi:hypothetical protein
MRSCFVAGAVIVLALPGPARAQNSPAPPASVTFPGSLNISVTGGEPTEPGNVTSSTTVEQGLTLSRPGPVFVVGYVSLSYRADSSGYDWNNTRPYRAGIKLVHLDSHGVFEASAGVMGEDRGQFAAARATAMLSYWRGWRGDALSGAASRLRPDAFPGYAYAVSGYLTSREAGNWITAAAIEQGATVYSRARIAVIPFVRASSGTDTDGRPWNNRSRADAGVKISRAISGGVIEAGVARRQSYVRSSRELTPSTVAFVNLWMGWTPRVIIQ